MKKSRARPLERPSLADRAVPAGPHAACRTNPVGIAAIPALVLILALALIPAGCSEPAPVVLAGAATNSFVNAVRLAVDDDAREHGAIQVLDTVLIQEVSNRAGPALEAAHELVRIPGLVAVVGHSNSAASLATSQVYNREGVTQIAPSSSAPLYSRAGPFSFRMVPPDDMQSRFLARMLADSVLDAGPVAILYVNDDYGRALHSGLEEELDRERHPVVLSLPHTEGDVHEPDLAHHLDALEASGAEALLFLGRPPFLNVLLPGIRERMGELPIVGSDALSRADLWTDRHAVWSGVRYVDFVDMNARPELRDFSRRYRERFGSEPGGPEVLSYDAARVVLAAIRQGARTGDDVREHLASLGSVRPAHPGLSGPIGFTPDGDMDREYVLRTIIEVATEP